MDPENPKITNKTNLHQNGSAPKANGTAVKIGQDKDSSTYQLSADVKNALRQQKTLHKRLITICNFSVFFAFVGISLTFIELELSEINQIISQVCVHCKPKQLA